MAQPDQPIEVFISYSKFDVESLRQLVAHLANLEREKLIDLWHDRELTAGEEWNEEINERLNSCGIILLLVSHHFLSSKFCVNVELPRVLERQDADGAIVIPILLSACEWEKAAFSKFQLLPSTRMPIASWEVRDEAFLDVVQGIRKAVEKLRARPEAPVSDPTAVKALGKSRLRPLLPYLCDRSEQEGELASHLRRHQQQKNTRPLLCVIHGDEYECHGWFLERLLHKSLPKFLDLELRQMSVREHPLSQLPRTNNLQAFWVMLGNALLGDSSATEEEIWQFISRHEEPMLLSLHPLTEDFEESGETLLQSLAEFCNNWPDLPPGRCVIICVCLKYQRFDKIGLFDFRKKRLRQLNERLRAQISQMTFSAYPNISGFVLPELQAIKRSDVESWSRSDQVREFCRLHEREIRAWFEHEELCNDQGRIPMELLADKLKSFIEG